MLSEFYAVTQTSVYHVTEKGDNGIHPAATKIALMGNSPLPIGSKLEGGTLIAICRYLLAFVPEGGGMTSYQREPGQVNTRWWGYNSSDIVALFKTRDDAMRCAEHPNLQKTDSRWIDSTVEVLLKIGYDHPSFVISRTPSIALLPTLGLAPR